MNRIEIISQVVATAANTPLHDCIGEAATAAMNRLIAGGEPNFFAEVPEIVLPDVRERLVAQVRRQASLRPVRDADAVSELEAFFEGLRAMA